MGETLKAYAVDDSGAGRVTIKVALIVGLVLFVIVVLVGVGIVRRRDATNAVVAVANQFEVPNSWELKSQRTTPDRVLCYSGGCPRVARRWTAPDELSSTEFVNLYRSVGWKLRLEYPCEPKATSADSNRRSCAASGEVDGQPVQIYYRPSTTEPTDAELVLFVN